MVKKSNLISIEFNGVKLEGTLESIQALGLDIQLGPTYKSKTHGEILIANMHDVHLRNAIMASYREWLTEFEKLIRQYETPNLDMQEMLDIGPCNHEDYANLMDEYERRARNER